MLSESGIADTCPTPEQVYKREVPRSYDWSVSEDVTLTMLLEVSVLKNVEIYNHGEFVACHYVSDQLPVRMDAAVSEPNCLVQKQSGQWLPLPGGVTRCTEQDLSLCQFQIRCYEQNPP